MKQWHPVFAQVLRPALEGYYDMQTTVPVGDAPREADFVLLRRTGSTPPPFQGLWRHLTRWNVLEFKGPTVSPRRGDIELLIELGLGIERRLRHERKKRRERPLAPEEVSYWYLGNHLGRRFFREAEDKLGTLQPLGPGLWRCGLLRRSVFLVSNIDVPVEEDSLPLHIVGLEPPATEREVARLVLEQPALQERYGGWLASLHPTAWKEVEAMARTARKRLVFDIRPAVESLGLDHVIEQIGIERVVEQIGIERVVEQIGVERVLAKMDENEVIKRIGLDRIVANLSAAERRELKKRL